jgi:hypothetical protein
MLLEFMVISYNSKCEEYSKSIVSNLNNCKNVSAKLDTNYSQSTYTRQSKYIKNDTDIILIDEVCLVNNEVIVKYSDKGSRAKRYDKNEFIELLESFESTISNNNNSNKQNNIIEKNENVIDEENTDDNTCSIM